MIEEIEELWKLAEECREWAKVEPGDREGPGWAREEFQRLAMKLDDIAKRLGARLPT